MNVDAAITAVAAEGGFDTSTSALTRATILGWINDRYQEAVVEAKWQKAVVELGPTVAGTSQYAIPAVDMDIASITVNASRPWKRVTMDDLWSLQAGNSLLRGTPGGFAPAFTSGGTPMIELFPTPSTAGYAIRALVAQLPDLLTDTAAAPVIPVDLHRPIMVDGAIALGRTVQDERPDLAASYEGRYEKAKRKLTTRGRSRVGSGAWQAKVAGVS